MKKIIFTLIFMVLFSYIFADLNFGKKLFEDGLFGEAIVEFEKTITAAPTSENAQNAMFLIGKSYRKKDDYLMAEATFKRLLDGYSNLSFREEAIYNLAIVQFEQKKYEPAILNFERLLEKYPLNDFTKKSLVTYLDAIYNTKNYNRVVVKARKLIKNYENYSNIPFVYLWLAKAYFANQMLAEGQQILAEITTKYSDHIVHWAAVDLEVELIQKQNGMQSSILYLEEKLSGEIPRSYEEKLRFKLAKTYCFSDNFHKSYQHLKTIVEKFSNSENLDEYIILLTKTQLALSEYAKIENDYQNFKKVFGESLLKLDYEFYLAEAKYFRRKHDEATDILQEIVGATSSQKLLNKAKFLEAKIKVAKGNYRLAIEISQELTDANFAIRNDVLQFIGKIYFEKFNDFQTALKYFQKVELSAKNHQGAIFKSAECYEKLGKIEQAVFELSRLNLAEIDNQIFKNKVANKLEYLQNYEQKNFEKAFNSLLNAIYDYSQTDDKIALRNDIFSIYSNDLKEFEKGLDLVKNDGSPQMIYQKALVYLQLAKKSFLNDDLSKTQEFMQIVDNLSVQLSEQKFPDWIAEIAIKKQLIQSSKVDELLIVKLENFVENFKDINATNEFRFLISQYYMKNDNFENAVKHIEDLEKTDVIDEQEFCEIKLQLAEYFYMQNDNVNALKNYELGEKFITINQPEVYFHFGVILHEMGFSINLSIHFAKCR